MIQVNQCIKEKIIQNELNVYDKIEVVINNSLLL